MHDIERRCPGCGNASGVGLGHEEGCPQAAAAGIAAAAGGLIEAAAAAFARSRADAATAAEGRL